MIDRNRSIIDEIKRYRPRRLRMVEFVGTLVPPEQGNSARARADEWVSDARARIAADIETIGK